MMRAITPCLPCGRPITRSTVEAAGFERFLQKNIRLVADQTATIDVQLKIGSTAETMTVSATGSSAPLVDSATPTLTEVVGTDANLGAAAERPRGRPVDQPGAGSHQRQPRPWSPRNRALPGSVQANINGSRNAQTGYMLDGAPFLDQYYNTNIPFPFPDALQEFSVQTSNYSARYGGNAGGVVNVVTKSGANSVHGDLFAFNRNQDYNAADAFSRAGRSLAPERLRRYLGRTCLYPASLQRPRQDILLLRLPGHALSAVGA